MDDDERQEQELLGPGGPPYFYDTLEKGTHLSIETLESILCLEQKKDPDKFLWAVRRLQSDIHEKTDLTCKIRVNGLDILLDEEASDHNNRLQQHYIRSLFYRQQKNLEVDVSNLSPDRRIAHDKNIARNGRLVNAMQQEIKQITLEVASKELPRNGKKKDEPEKV